jgi:hypothetical protein
MVYLVDRFHVTSYSLKTGFQFLLNKSSPICVSDLQYGLKDALSAHDSKNTHMSWSISKNQSARGEKLFEQE